MSINLTHLSGTGIDNYVNLIATNRHYTVTYAKPELKVVSGLLDVIQEFSKYRRRMEWVLENDDFFSVYYAGFYVGWLRAGRVGRGYETQVIFGSFEHNRPRAPQGLAYNEEYSASVKTAAKKASEMFKPATMNTLITKFGKRVCVIFTNDSYANYKENSIEDETVSKYINGWKGEILKGTSTYRSDERLLQTVLFYLLDARNKVESDDWDAPESANGEAELNDMLNKFRDMDKYMDAYRKLVRNKARFEKMSALGCIMSVNYAGKPTLILRSDGPDNALKVPMVIYDHIEKVEDLPDHIQEAYHAVRLAGLNIYVEGVGMYVGDGTDRNIDDRILGSCVWLDPSLFMDYGMTSLS